MKGLFIKDLLIIKGRKQIFLVVGLLVVVYAMMGMGAFAMQFMSLMGTTIAISTASFDSMDNGSAFLFALPFTRRQYVTEKYLFSVGGGVVGMLIGTIIVIISQLTGAAAAESVLPYVGAGIIVNVVMVSVMLPLDIKFGSERSRTAMFAFVAAILIIAYLIAKLVPITVLERIGGFLISRSVAELGLGLAVFAIVLLAISLLVSFHIIEKKEY